MLTTRKFLATNKQGEPASVTSTITANCPGEKCKAGEPYSKVTFIGEMADSRTAEFPLGKLGAPLNVARFIVSYAMMIAPKVGGAIDILRVTKDGACWIQHKKEGEGCETDIPECPCASTSTPQPVAPPAKPTPTKQRRTHSRKRP